MRSCVPLPAFLAMCLQSSLALTPGPIVKRSPERQAFATTRREACSAFVSTVFLGTAGIGSAQPAQAASAKNLALLQVDLVLILRVQEATTQETRLVSTGKYKELQRLNIKRAIRFMLDNYSLRDRFVAASAYAPAKSQQQVLSAAQRAVESLTQILEYFPNDLVANDLSPEQKTFVLAALESTSTSIDGFLEQMPAEVVSAARRQIAEENQLNEQEYSEGWDLKILNAK